MKYDDVSWWWRMLDDGVTFVGWCMEHYVWCIVDDGRENMTKLGVDDDDNVWWMETDDDVCWWMMDDDGRCIKMCNDIWWYMDCGRNMMDDDDVCMRVMLVTMDERWRLRNDGWWWRIQKMEIGHGWLAMGNDGWRWLCWWYNEWWMVDNGWRTMMDEKWWMMATML